MRDHALAYASRGWPVFPLRGKRPLTEHGLLEATTDPDQILAWWSSHPKANVGVRCASCYVLDVDPRHGGDVALREITTEHGRLRCPTVRTGSGGWHLYWAPIELGKEEELRRHPVDGCDGCGPRHYVVAPPSLHPDTGQPYRWVRPLVSPLPELPHWLRSIAVRTAAPAPSGPVRAPEPGAERRASKWLDRVEGAVSGQRGHDATYRVACSLVQRFGLDDSAAWSLLCNWNQRCQPPWPEPALRRKLAEARKGT